jgi:hypothetical protein
LKRSIERPGMLVIRRHPQNAPASAVRKRSQRQTKMMGQKRWTKRSRASGEFMSQKKPGRREQA